MPEISRFFGIIISMFFDEHNPPHFHAKYGEFKASIDINDFAILGGTLPARALGLVIEWAMLHKEELMLNWKLAGKGKPLLPIEPLQ